MKKPTETQQAALYARMKGFYGVDTRKRLLSAAVVWMPVLKPGYRRPTAEEFVKIGKELRHD